MSIKPQKHLALLAAKSLAPEYAELIQNFKRDGGRIKLPPEALQIQHNVASYVMNYDSELKIGCALFLAFLGEEGFKEYFQSIEKASPEEQQKCIDEMAEINDTEIEEFLSGFELPKTREDREAALRELERLPGAERKEQIQRGAYFYGFVFASFFNALSVMVHGAKMTSLVPLALAGDDDAFLKAVQIDRMLLLHHPYFRDRKSRAQNEGDTAFLSKLSYRESNPPVRGKIRYPGLYMLFAILEAYRWLDDLKHEEILNLCDEAGLDRYQNRIEDVNYLTKRLIEYRSWQRMNALSMR